MIIFQNKQSEIVECDNWLDVALHFDIGITTSGEVYLDGSLLPTSYRKSEFDSVDEMLSDFAQYTLPKYKCIYSAKRL